MVGYPVVVYTCMETVADRIGEVMIFLPVPMKKNWKMLAIPCKIY